MSIVCAAPAKLNLCLHIVGKRQDGFHLLESLVAFAAYGDQLEVYPADALSLSIEGEFADALRGDISNNLVLKAARLLRDTAQVSDGARIVLHKNLPIGSGMGGGSCDAAACLRALAALWEVELPDKIWREIALQLGSDVPMCLAQRPVFAMGVGEALMPWDIRNVKAYVVLVHPRKALLTADVYRRFSGVFDEPMIEPSSMYSFDALIACLAPLHNALQPAAQEAMPEIGQIIDELAKTQDCALARMTGSGAGCFALYATHEQAEQAAQQIRQQRPDWWCVATALEGKYEA